MKLGYGYVVKDKVSLFKQKKKSKIKYISWPISPLFHFLYIIEPLIYFTNNKSIIYKYSNISELDINNYIIVYFIRLLMIEKYVI